MTDERYPLPGESFESWWERAEPWTFRNPLDIAEIAYGIGRAESNRSRLVPFYLVLKHALEGEIKRIDEDLAKFRANGMEQHGLEMIENLKVAAQQALEAIAPPSASLQNPR